MKAMLFVLFFGTGIHLYAQAFDEAKEKTQIKNTIKIMADAWAHGDAQKFTAPHF